MTTLELSMKTMAAAKCKAQFLSVVKEVQAKREPVLVTKHGRPAVKVVPVADDELDVIFGFYKGKIKIVGDIEAPLFTEEELDEFEQTLAQLK